MATLPVTLINFPNFHDKRGYLSFCEGNTHIPFEIKRVFWIYGSPYDAIRGGHAHKECEQVIIAVSGFVNIFVDWDIYLLADSSEGLYIPPGVSVTMRNFSDYCVLLVLCSHHFSEEDYVRTTNG